MSVRVRDLVGGDLISLGHGSATFIGRSEHPRYPGLALVVWVLADGRPSLDALSYDQVVGELSNERDDGWAARLTDAMAAAAVD
jgi:hypothetical protein